MARGMDPVKVSAWRERFDRFAASGGKAAQFCADEGVNPATFYAWRGKLGLANPRSKKKSRVFQQVTVSSVPALSARLPGGVTIEASGANEEALRTIVNELVRASQDRAADREGQPC